jgi:hypothetical protein
MLHFVRVGLILSGVSEHKLSLLTLISPLKLKQLTWWNANVVGNRYNLAKNKKVKFSLY